MRPLNYPWMRMTEDGFTPFEVIFADRKSAVAAQTSAYGFAGRRGLRITATIENRRDEGYAVVLAPRS